MENSDLDLIENIKQNNDESSLKELISRHSALCFDIYKRYAPTIQASGLCVNEICKEKDLILWKAVLSFNPDKNVKFSTWLGNNIRFQCLNAINGNGQYLLLEDKELQRQIDKNNEMFAPENNSNTLEYIFNILDKLKDQRIKQIFILRYMESGRKKMTWSKIAAKLGVSTQTAINLHEKGKRILKQKLTSNECFDKI
jgi:RNA polymerase sigma factor (sigma-70 family)